ncbi:60S ribosomal protein L12 [Angomonas deanei]|nr:60S ribosomal protein L12 [Angomonas deanei]|eukprot:EPY41732.1 60S ribosomal protein L12 [Angomonas deanei]
MKKYTGYCLVGNSELAVSDLVLDGLGRLTLDLAADGDGGTKHLHHYGLEVGTHGLGLALLGDLDDLRKGDVAVVLDVLHLLAVARRLLEGADDTRGGGGGDNNGGNTVLDAELAGDLETLPVLGGLGDVLTDLLGVQTKRTDLGGEGGSSGNLTTDGTHDDDELFVGVKLGRHEIS